MPHRALSSITALAMALMPVFSSMAQEAIDAPAPYENWKIVDVSPRTAQEHLALAQLGENLSCTPRPGAQRLLLEPGAYEALLALGVPHNVLSENVRADVERESAMRAESRAQRGADFFADYRAPSEIDAYLNELVTLRPDLAQLLTVGTTIEGRTIRAIRITGPAVPGEPTRPTIIINAGQHAREWIAPATAMWAVERLILDHGINAETTDLVNRVNWIIVPSLNRDGYQYSIDSTRLWRKNRRNNGDGTFGVDLNRNWSYQWGGASTSGSGSSDLYRGTGPFSEPESSALRDFVLAQPNVKALIDLHSYSQLILGPWGYSRAVLPPRELELRATGDAMQAAMVSTHGTIYQEGLGVDALIYEASGVLPDWSFFQVGALSWTYELRDTGSFGFTLPPNQIIPTGQEAFEGLKQLGRYVQVRLDLSLLLPPTTAPINQAVTLNVRIIPFNGFTLAPGSARLMWRVGASGPFMESPISGVGTDLSVTIPAQSACGQAVQYFVTAVANDGTIVTFPPDAPASVRSFTLENLTVAVDDPVESLPIGWTVGLPGDTAVTGGWEQADPNGTLAAPEDDRTPGSGTMCFVTGNGKPGESSGQSDIDNGVTTLISPVMDLSGGTSATISYWRWFYNGSSPGNDVFTVDLSNNDGSTWTRVETVGPSGPATRGGWLQHTFNAAAFLPLTNQMRLRFIAGDTGTQQVVEAAIDDLRAEVSSACPPPPSCPGDADGDSAVGLSDIAAVVNAWGTSDPNADLDGDGAVGLSDLAQVIEFWGQACG